MHQFLNQFDHLSIILYHYKLLKVLLTFIGWYASIIESISQSTQMNNYQHFETFMLTMFTKNWSLYMHWKTDAKKDEYQLKILDRKTDSLKCLLNNFKVQQGSEHMFRTIYGIFLKPLATKNSTHCAWCLAKIRLWSLAKKD